MCLVTKMDWFFQFLFPIKKFEDSMDLLLSVDDDKSHYA